MKRIAIIVLALCFLAASLSAQKPAWINPNDTTDLATLGGLPGTLLAQTSRGIFIDEWDAVFHAPAMLSDWTGINVLTSYGNYGSWYTGGAPAPVSLISTGGFAPAPFLVGVSMPLMGFRAAAVAGLDFQSVTENLGGSTISQDGSVTYVADANTIGTADYTINSAFNITDYSLSSSYLLAAAADLGLLGASAWLQLGVNTRTLGGQNTATFTAGTDAGYTVAANQITSRTINYVGKNGKPILLGNDGGPDTGVFGAIAQLPLPGLPLTAGVDISWSNQILNAFFVNNLPVYYRYTTSNAGGVANATLSYDYTDTAGASTTWDNNLTDQDQDTELTYGPRTLAQVQTAANNTNILDPSGISASTFGANLKGAVEPIISLPNGIKLATRAKLTYHLGIEALKRAYATNVSYNQAVDGTATNNIQLTSSYSFSNSSTAIYNNFDLELGGVFEFARGDGLLTLGSGFFLLPSMVLGNLSTGTARETKSKSIANATNAPGAGGWNGLAAPAAQTDPTGVMAILNAAGGFLGSGAYTQTTTYSGSENLTSLGLDFTIPLSLKLNLAKAKMQFICGYDITTGFSYSYYKDNTDYVTTYTDVRLADANGNNLYTAPVAPFSVEDSQSSSGVGNWAVSPVSGTLDWMLRWDPLPAMTIDISGSAIMGALNFSIFGGAGFNPANFLDSLSMSVTFHL